MINELLISQIDALIDANCRKYKPKTKNKSCVCERALVKSCINTYDVDSEKKLCNDLLFDEKLEDSFSTALLEIIDKKGLKDVDIYNKALVDRRLFSKIRSSSDKKVAKKTAIALCLALELSLDETQELLARAGYTLSKSNRSDIIVKVCIENNVFDIQEVDGYLLRYKQRPLAKY